MEKILNIKKDRINKNWNFWKKIILKKDGTVNLSQVKKELSDYSFIIEEVPKVYMDITGGILSKPNYYASTVINKADERYRELYLESFREFLECMRDDLVITPKAFNKMNKEINNHI